RTTRHAPSPTNGPEGSSRRPHRRAHRGTAASSPARPHAATTRGRRPRAAARATCACRLASHAGVMGRNTAVAGVTGAYNDWPGNLNQAEEVRMSAPLQINQRSAAETVILELTGQLVADEDDLALREQVATLVGAGWRHLLLDLSRITYMD